MNFRFVYPPNLPEIKGTSHIFYKTRMCAKFLEGTCRNGEYCTYAHGVEDLWEPPSSWRDLVREKDREWNDDQKIIHRMTICQKFYKGEECPYGDKCNFLHERPNMPRQRESFAVSIETTGNRSNPVHIEPIYWKRKICSKWEITGQCPYRDRCHFAHGQSELQAATGRLETEMLLNSGSIAPRTFSLPLAELSFAHTVVNASIQQEKEEKKILKWKRSNICGIYGDWIDDHVPPHLLPNNAQS